MDEDYSGWSLRNRLEMLAFDARLRVCRWRLLRQFGRSSTHNPLQVRRDPLWQSTMRRDAVGRIPSLVERESSTEPVHS
jgi:hypothetical protein